MSGSSCVLVCPTGKFANIANHLCDPCDVKCTVCSATSGTICSSCTTTGVNQAYLSGTSCLLICPVGTFANSTNHLCDTCSP